MGVNQEVQELVFRYDASALTKADADVRRYTDHIDALDDKLGDATATATRLTSAMHGVDRGNKEAVRSVIELSRGFQDFYSAGLYGIANNVEGLGIAFKGLFSEGILGGIKAMASSLWGPAGLIAGFTIMTTAGPEIFKAIKNWLDLEPDVESFADQVKRLAGETKNVGDEAAKSRAKLDAMFQTPAQKEATDRARKVITEGPQGQQIGSILVAQEIDRLTQADPAQMERIKTQGELGRLIPQIEQQRKQLEAERVRTTTPGATFSLSRTEEIDKRLADITRNLPDLQKQYAQAASDIRTKVEMPGGIRQQATEAVQSRIQSMTPEDQKSIADLLNRRGMQGVASELRRLTPEFIEAERKAKADIKEFAERSRDELKRRAERRRGTAQADEAASQRTPEEEAQANLPEQTGKQAAAAQERRRQARQREAQGEARRSLPGVESIQESVIRRGQQQTAADLAKQLEKTGLSEADAARQAGEDVTRAAEMLEVRFRAALQQTGNAIQAQAAVYAEVSREAKEARGRAWRAEQLARSVRDQDQPALDAAPVPAAGAEAPQPPRPGRNPVVPAGFHSIPAVPPMRPAEAARAAVVIPAGPMSTARQRWPQVPPQAPPSPIPAVAPVVGAADRMAAAAAGTQDIAGQTLGLYGQLEQRVAQLESRNRALQSGVAAFHRTNQLRGR